MTEKYTIGDYYDRIDRERREAWAKVYDAIEWGASPLTIAKLRQAAIDTGDTGD